MKPSILFTVVACLLVAVIAALVTGKVVARQTYVQTATFLEEDRLALLRVLQGHLAAGQVDKTAELVRGNIEVAQRYLNELNAGGAPLPVRSNK